MKYKITTLTPIHIATGEKNPSFLYHINKDGYLDCFKIEDLIKDFKPSQLLELNLKDSSNNGKKELIRVFNKYVNYAKINPLYSLYYDDDHMFTLDSSVQIKTMGRPYIPGSSLKGAVMNAILFSVFYQEKNNLKQFVDKHLKCNHVDKEVLSYLFGYDYNDVLNDFSSCICCEDVLFKHMILGHPLRLNMGNSNNQLGVFECIDNLEETVTHLFFIDSSRKQVFKKKYGQLKIYKTLSLFLNPQNILKACRLFTRYLISEEKSYFKEDKFNYFSQNDFEGRSQIIDFLDKMDFKDENAFYLKVGNSTNYFSKSVSLFFKRFFSDFYKQNFNEFSPVKLNQKKPGKIPTPDKMPKTRTVIEFDGECYLAGYLKIECIE